jgi:hypothetical protein
LHGSAINRRLNIDRGLDRDVGRDRDHGRIADALVHNRISPVHRRGPSMLGCLLVLHRLGSSVRRLVNHHMPYFGVMAHGEQETTFQAFDRGLEFDRTAGSSTIRLNDRIHDRYGPSWANVQRLQ